MAASAAEVPCRWDYTNAETGLAVPFEGRKLPALAAEGRQLSETGVMNQVLSSLRKNSRQQAIYAQGLKQRR